MRALKGLVPLLLLAAPAGCAPAAGTSFHIDFEKGRDTADGRTPATAWKHAPGDPAASGGPAAVKLVPGDRVLFRAGVPYRGMIKLKASGSAEKPIVYTGIGWGDGLGIIDGADPVTSARPCRNAADCGGAADWAQLTRVDYAAPETSRIVLYGTDGLYWLSQSPALPDPFYSDARKFFEKVSKGQLADLKRGVLHSPALARAARAGGQMELAFWVLPNLVKRVALKGVEGDRLLFDAEGVRFWEDRDGAVALSGSFEGLQEAGRYVQLRPGVLVARLRPGDGAATLAVGSGRMGINLGGQSNVTITGLNFRNMTAAAERWREGLAVTAVGPLSTNIEVSGNLFGPAFLESRRGIVQLRLVEDFRFLANRIENIAFGAGLRVEGGNPGRVLIAGNVIRRTGSTAIALLRTHDVQVTGNILADIRGVHGNGLTAYLGNHDILFAGNCVILTDRPLTFHGDRKGAEPNRLVIRDNILISSPDGQAAINSWGSKTRDVRIENNLLVGPKEGLRLNASDSDIVVRGNDTSGIVVPKGSPSSWKIADNSTGLTLAGVAGGSFSENGCSVPGTRIAPVTRSRFDSTAQPQ